MGLSLLDESCKGLVELSHTQLGLTGIHCLEGLLERSAEERLQGFGVDPAVDQGIVPLVGVFDLWRHDVSFLGQLPRLCVEGEIL